MTKRLILWTCVFLSWDCCLSCQIVNLSILEKWELIHNTVSRWMFSVWRHIKFNVSGNVFCNDVFLTSTPQSGTAEASCFCRSNEGPIDDGWASYQQTTPGPQRESQEGHRKSDLLLLPIPSMYGIFAYIWLVFMVHVGEYTIRGSYVECSFGGFWLVQNHRPYFQKSQDPLYESIYM